MSDTGSARPLGVERRPEKIGRYRILERIGKGAMGVVYAARDELMDRDVALKVLMTDLDGDPDMRARFFREAQVAARLVHKNVVTIFDLGEDDGRLFIVMELLRGDTLQQYLQRGAELEEKIDLAIQICDGLTVASAAGIFHRDIKPGNLFIQRDGSLKILDFGIARLASSSMTASGFIVGTPDYMSPEQARGEVVDGRSDQFSVGAVLYLMLSGRKPFLAPNLPAILHKVVSEDPPPLSEQEAPPALARIAFRAMAKEPANRYADFREMAGDLAMVRRRHEAETHALAAAAAGDYQAIEKLFATWRELSATLGLPEPDTRSSLQESVGRIPAFLEKPETLNRVVLRRSAVQPIASRLGELRASVHTRIATLQSLCADLDQAAQALARGETRSALAQFESLLRRSPDSPVIAAQAAHCRTLVGSDQALEDGTRALLAQSATERRLERLGPALALAEEAALRAPRNSEAAQLVTALRAQIARRDAERRERADGNLQKARRALGKGRFDEVQTLLRLVHEDDPGNAAAAEIEGQAVAARAARDVADERAKDVASRLAAARRAFDEGQHTVAVASLEALAAEVPEARTVEAELSRQRLEIDRLALARRTAEVADGFAEAAQVAWAAGDAAKTVRLAEQALAAVRTHERAIRLAALARARVREVADRETRIARAAGHVGRARALLDRQRFDRAIREAELAMDLDPSGPEGPAVLAEALRKRDAERVAREHAEEIARRTRVVRTTLADARAAVAVQDFVRAEALAQQALVLDPGNDDIRRALDSVAAGRAAVAAQQEDTVDRQPRPLDFDDTAEIPLARRDDRFISLARGIVALARDRFAGAKGATAALVRGIVVLVRARLTGGRRAAAGPKPVDRQSSSPVQPDSVKRP